MLYVPDSHALLWYVTADKRIGLNASAALSSVDAGENQAAISPLVLAEILYLEEKARIHVKLGALIEQFKTNENYFVAPLTLAIVSNARRIPKVPDLFDRLIAATALTHNAVLLTRDSVFADHSELEILW